MNPTSPVRIAPLADLADGIPVNVNIDGIQLVVASYNGNVSVFDGVCPHQGTLLGDGEIVEGILVCSGHGWRFDCSTGSKLDDPSICLHRFTPQIVDGDIAVSRDELRAFKKNKASAASVAEVRDLSSLPGPRGLPLLGNLFQLEQDRQHLILEEWADKYGYLYGFRLGRQSVLVVADPTLIEVVLKQRPHTYRRLRAMAKVTEELGAAGVFSAEGDDWRRQRKVTTQALNPVHLRNFFPTLYTIAGRLKSRWDEAAASGREIELLDEFAQFTLDVTSAFAFGYDLNTIEGKGGMLEKQIAEIPKALTRRSTALLPYWRFVKLPADRALDRALNAIHDTFSSLIVDARQRLASDPERAVQPTNFLEALLIEQSAGDGTFTDKDVVGNVLTMLLAGEDTTAMTLAWMVYFLSERPDVQEVLQSEADRVLGENSLLREFSDHNELVQLEAAAHETMRLKPVAPLIWMETNVATELGGVRLPAQTPVFLLTRQSVLRELTATAIEEFQMDRWLTSSGESIDVAAAKAFFPFGAGPRYCPGRSLALLEIKVIISMLCRNFSIKRVDRGVAVGERFAFTMRPTNLAVRLNRR